MIGSSFRPNTLYKEAVKKSKVLLSILPIGELFREVLEKVGASLFIRIDFVKEAGRDIFPIHIFAAIQGAHPLS